MTDGFDSSDNPYAAPEAELHEPGIAVETALLLEPRAVEASRGWLWCRIGLALYRRSPGMWVVDAGAVMSVNMLLAFLGLPGSIITSLLHTVFMAGLMAGARDVAADRPLTFAHVGAGFKQRTGALIGAGGLYFAGFLVVMIVVGLLAFPVVIFAGFTLDPENGDPALFAMIILLFVLIGDGVSLPLVMAIWFAPPLLFFHAELATVEAMKLSFRGCYRNVLPFLVWGLVLAAGALALLLPTIVLAVLLAALFAGDAGVGIGAGRGGEILAAILVAVTFLASGAIFAPLVYTSTYAAYRDLFLAESADGGHDPSAEP